jgi:hypothetical protein
MAAISKIPVVWTGLTGLPGLSVFYSAAGGEAAVVTALNTLLNAVKTQFPTGLTWQTPSAGDSIEDTTGQLVGGWSGASGANIAANGGSTAYAAGTGMYIRWATLTVVNGRRLKGRTFMCPILAAAYDTNGTVQNATVTTWQTAVDAFVAGCDSRIWHRPTGGLATGTSAVVTAGVVPDVVTSLRSRRN